MKSGFIEKFRWLMRSNTTRQYLVHSCLLIYHFGARLNCNTKEPLKWVLSTQVETSFCFMWYPRSKWRRLVEQQSSCRDVGAQVPRHCCFFGWRQITSSLMLYPKGMEYKKRQSRQPCAQSHPLFSSPFPIFNHRKTRKK